GDVHCHRCRYERAISAFERAACVAALFAKARALDAALEAVHGLLAVRDAALFALCARCTTRLGGSDLGELFPACDQCRVLDESRVRRANSVSCEADRRARAYGPARHWERCLFYRRKISVGKNCFRRFPNPG